MNRRASPQVLALMSGRLTEKKECDEYEGEKGKRSVGGVEPRKRAMPTSRWPRSRHLPRHSNGRKLAQVKEATRKQG